MTLSRKPIPPARPPAVAPLSTWHEVARICRKQQQGRATPDETERMNRRITDLLKSQGIDPRRRPVILIIVPG